MRVVWSFLALCLVVCGCSARSSENVPVDVSKAPKVVMRDVKWDVINRDGKTSICLDPHSYSNMTLNMEDLKLYIIYQNKVIHILRD